MDDIVERAIRRERERCVEICRRRAKLWRETASTTPSHEASVEARSRANEANYLADLLETGEDLVESLL